MSDESTDVSAKIAGQEISVKNLKRFNDLATFATLMGVCVLGYAFVGHANDTKDASRELVVAIKENAQAQREGNCLIAFPPEKREVNADLCKRLSR